MNKQIFILIAVIFKKFSKYVTAMRDIAWHCMRDYSYKIVDMI